VIADKKVRQTPHVEGNFLTRIYINLSNEPEFQRILGEIKKKLQHRHVEVKLFKTAELHISLTKELYINYHQIKEFERQIEELLSKFMIFSSIINFSKVKLLKNISQTRFFAVIPV